MQIVVERLTKNVNEDHLFEIFGEYGEIDDLDLPVNRSCAPSPAGCCPSPSQPSSLTHLSQPA
jgi:RNA recognition motif-containing protein